MQVKPVSPPNGSELLVLNKDGRTLYVTRPQVAAILASTGVRSKPMRSVLTERTGQERYRAIQGGVLVEFSLADFTAYLAGTATPDPVPFGRGLDVYSGTERFVGRQGTGLIASDIMQTMYVRGLGGSLAGLGGDIPDNPLPTPTPSPTPTPTPTPTLWYDDQAVYDVDFANSRAYSSDGTAYAPADLFTGLPASTAGRGVFIGTGDNVTFGPILTQMMRGAQGTIVVDTAGVGGLAQQRIIGGGSGTGGSIDSLAVLNVIDMDSVVSYVLSSTAGPVKAGTNKAGFADRCSVGLTWSGTGEGGSARKICMNGGPLGAVANGGIGNPVNFYLGRSLTQDTGNNKALDGYISRIRFFPNNMDDATFQAKCLTADLPVIANLATPRIIFDSDFASDFDDAGALKIAVNLHKAGECTIIAAASSSRNVYSAPALRAMLDWSGLTAIPVGSYKGSTGSGNSGFTQQVAANFGQAGKTRADFPDPVIVFRTALAAAPDGSVVYNNVGGMANFAALLASPADGISPLTGVQLVAAKVNRVAQQGGREVRAVDFNLAEQPADAAYVFANCPVPIHFIANWPNLLKTGLPDGDGTLDPYRLAYGPNGNTRESWDPVTTLYAIRGVGTHFTFNSVNGTLRFTASTAASEYDPTTAGRDTMVFRARAVTSVILRDTLNAIMAIDSKAATGGTETPAPAPSPAPAPAPAPSPAPSANLWTPAALSADMASWWDASDSSTITLESGAVSEWRNKVSGGPTASQATAANRPVFSATARNGRPGITSNGTTQRLLFTPTGFPVGDGESTEMMVGYSASATAFRYLLGYGDTTAGANRQMGRDNSGNPTASSGVTAFNIFFTTQTWNDVDNIITRSSTSGSTPQTNLNANGSGTPATKSNTQAYATGTSLGRLFCAIADNTFWQGSAQEIFVFRRVLTTDERQRLTGYVAHKWGLTDKLPADHPYKTSPPTV